MNSLEPGFDEEEMKRESSYKILDTATTAVRLFVTIVSVIVGIIGAVSANTLFQSGYESLDHMPDGSGVADGYILIGKLFAGGLAGLAGIIILVIVFCAGVLAGVGAILCAVYICQRNKYKKTAQLRYLGRNFIVKAVVNMGDILLLLWIIVENRIYTVPAIAAVTGLGIAEVLLVVNAIHINRRDREMG